MRKTGLKTYKFNLPAEVNNGLKMVFDRSRSVKTPCGSWVAWDAMLLDQCAQACSRLSSSKIFYGRQERGFYAANLF
jgi:hypothetical protein